MPGATFVYVKIVLLIYKQQNLACKSSGIQFANSDNEPIGKVALGIANIKKALFILLCTVYILFGAERNHIIYADVFIPEYGPGKKETLNGKWKYCTKNLPGFYIAEFDDTDWKTINVPGAWQSQGIKGKNVLWYRHTFTPSKKKKYSWLRFEQTLDEAEVWLNGRKLKFPVFQPPLEETQHGVYQRVWLLDWPNAFPISGILKPGEENTIAVRVVNDPARKSHYIEKHDSAPFKGLSGITGNVYLVSHPPVFINMIERLSNYVVWNGLIEHRIFVMLGNMMENPADCDVSLKIITLSGDVIFTTGIETKVEPGGEIVDFSWKTSPVYEKYTAIVTLKTSAGVSDTAALQFNGTHIVATSDSIIVNTDEFRVKGVEGIPGGTYTGGAGGLLTLDRKEIAKQVEKLHTLGVNTIRLPEPAPDIMKETARQAIMVIPVLSTDWAKTVLALREYPNILYWDISGSSKREIIEMVKTIRALDHYRRPIAYSGPLDTDFTDFYYAGINIYGEDANSFDTQICETGSALNKNSKPVTFLRWGETTADSRGNSLFRILASMNNFWKKCVATGLSGGVVYSRLSDVTGGPQKDANIGSSMLFADELAFDYGDFDVKLDNVHSGKSSLKLRLRGPNSIYNIITYAGSRSKGNMIARRNRLTPGGELRIDILNDSLLKSDFIVTYVSHGGMEREFTTSAAKPVFSPEHFFFTNKWTSFKYGIPSSVGVRILGGEIPRSARVSLSSNNPRVRVEPARRGVSIPGNEFVDVPFTITCPDAGAEAVITATLYFTDGPGLPMKAHLPVEFR